MENENAIIINFLVPSTVAIKNYGNLSSSISLASSGWENQHSIVHKKVITNSYSVHLPIGKIKEDFIQ